jgi:transposase
LKALGEQPPCIMAMEACAGAHPRGRAIDDLDHEVRPIAPACAKPFVTRQKNDMADAEAIAEAASPPTTRFAAVKSEAQQAAAMGYGTGDLLVRQRTRTINASCQRHACRRRAGGTPAGVSRRHAFWREPEVYLPA